MVLPLSAARIRSHRAKKSISGGRARNVQIHCVVYGLPKKVEILLSAGRWIISQEEENEKLRLLICHDAPENKCDLLYCHNEIIQMIASGMTDGRSLLWAQKRETIYLAKCLAPPTRYSDLTALPIGSHSHMHNSIDCSELVNREVTQLISHKVLQQSRAMDTVPVCFIESALRSFQTIETPPYAIAVPPGEQQKLGGLWGLLSRENWKEGGDLDVMYAPNGQNQWRFYYRLVGFSHIQTRTLSREVAKEISKSIRSVNFSVSNGNRPLQHWTLITLNDEEEILRLLIRLDAPTKKLEFPNCISIQFHVYSRLVSNYSYFLKTFTSVIQRNSCRPSQRPFFAHFVKDMTCTGKLHSLHVKVPPPAPTYTGLVVDYFFSESCRRLTVEVCAAEVLYQVINRWKKLNPRLLTPYKIINTKFVCVTNPYALPNVQIIRMSAIEVEILEIIERNVAGAERSQITSLYRIDHPVHPSDKIYVIFFGIFGRALLFT
uniref:Mediator of RNA polymerase II transcription subunit 13 n=1 Tax=Steinernema glaseri TaxID=37863 RepID=A0A1I7YQA4_9BILA